MQLASWPYFQSYNNISYVANKKNLDNTSLCKYSLLMLQLYFCDLYLWQYTSVVREKQDCIFWYNVMIWQQLHKIWGGWMHLIITV